MIVCSFFFFLPLLPCVLFCSFILPLFFFSFFPPFYGTEVIVITLLVTQKEKKELYINSVICFSVSVLTEGVKSC